jgi:hypothetical protein
MDALYRPTKSTLSFVMYACLYVCLFACLSLCQPRLYLRTVYSPYIQSARTTQHNIPSIFTEFQSQHENTFHHPCIHGTTLLHRQSSASTTDCPRTAAAVRRYCSAYTRSRGHHGRFTTVGRCLIRRFASPLSEPPNLVEDRGGQLTT